MENNIVSSEYQRREKLAKELEKKKKALEILDYNYQIKKINSAVRLVLSNYPKSLPLHYSDIIVFPNKVKRIVFPLYSYRISSGKHLKIINIYMSEKGEFVIEAPIREKDKNDDTVVVRKCFFLKLNVIQDSFSELSSGIDFLEDEKFFKEIVNELAGLFCSERRFRGMFNIAPVLDSEKYYNSKPSVLIAKEEYAKERNEAFLKVAVKIAIGVLCALVVIIVLAKVL